MARNASSEHSGSTPASSPETDCSMEHVCQPATLLVGLSPGGARSEFTLERTSPGAQYLAVIRLDGGQGRFAKVGEPKPAGGSKGPGLRLWEANGRSEYKTGHPYPLPRKGARLLLVEGIRESPQRGFRIPIEYLDREGKTVCQTDATVQVIRPEIYFESALVRRTGKMLCTGKLRMTARGRGVNAKNFDFRWSFPRGTFDKPKSKRPTLTASSAKTPNLNRDEVVLELSLKKNPACRVRVSRPLNVTTPESVSLRGAAVRDQRTQLDINNFSSASKRKGNRRLFRLRVRYVIRDQFGADINDSYEGSNRKLVKIREQVQGNLTVRLPNNTGNEIRVNNVPRFTKPSKTGRINDLLQATFAKRNLVKIESGRVSFAIDKAGADYLTLRPHPWFVAIGNRRGGAVINARQVTNNDLRCYVERVLEGGRKLVVRTTYVITLV